jgi:ATP-binding cassette subfamily F protein 3
LCAGARLGARLGKGNGEMLTASLETEPKGRDSEARSFAMLTIRNLKKSHGGNTLFENASMQVNYGERVALVGPNGAGKSTIFSIILRHDEPDQGTVDRDEWTMVGFLPQEAEAVGDETVLDIATGRATEVPALEKKLRELEQAGTVDGPDYLEAHAKHEALTNPKVDAKAKRMLAGLGYKEGAWDRPARTMSGGWVMRAHLARLLVMEPDLLMLDEPTNHLDLVSLLWLQNYLKSYSGAVLLISHDRQFMDEIVETVFEISEKKLFEWKGNYSAYLELREAAYERQQAAYKNQQKEISDLREFYDRFRQVASKASQAMSKLKQIERMDLVEKPVPPKNPVYSGMSLDVERDERTVLVGPNGAGKSTLLKILAGVVDFQKGERKLGLNVKIGYFSQHRAATLDAEKTILQEVMDAAPTLAENEARGILGSFLFRKDDIYKKTAVAAQPDQVSGGSAEPFAHGRTHDASGHPHRRVAAFGLGALRGDAGVHLA